MYIQENSNFPPPSSEVKIQRLEFRLNRYRLNSDFKIANLVTATASFLDEIKKQIDLIKTYNDVEKDKHQLFKDKQLSKKLDELIIMFDNELDCIIKDKT